MGRRQVSAAQKQVKSIVKSCLRNSYVAQVTDNLLISLRIRFITLTLFLQHQNMSTFFTTEVAVEINKLLFS